MWDPREGGPGIKIKTKEGVQTYTFQMGFDVLIKAAAQLTTGKGVSSVTGKPFERTPKQIAETYLRGGLGWGTGFVWDSVKGHTFGDRKSLDSVAEYAKHFVWSAVPITVQDITEFAKFGPLGVLGVSAGFIGGSNRQYEIKPSDVLYTNRNDRANEVFGKPWDQVGPLGQEYLTKVFPTDLTLPEEQKDLDVVRNMQIVEDQARKSAKRIYNRLTPQTAKVLKDAAVDIPSAGKVLFKNWIINDDTQKTYEARIAEVMNQIVGDLAEKDEFVSGDVITRNKVLTSIIGKIKKHVREEIRDEATIKDVQSLQQKRAIR
jgi:hypothetical protein